MAVRNDFLRLSYLIEISIECLYQRFFGTRARNTGSQSTSWSTLKSNQEAGNGKLSDRERHLKDDPATYAISSWGCTSSDGTSPKRGHSCSQNDESMKIALILRSVTNSI